MNPDLEKILLNPFFLFKRQDQEIKKDFISEDFTNLKKSTRLFTNKQKDECWKRAQKISGRDPDRWRLDAAGNPVLKALKGCNGPLCHEYDHIIPYSKGGETTIRNCQVLQSFANRSKGNKTHLNGSLLQQNSLKVELKEYDMDLVEELVYGNVKKL
jgi:hypothetical protein